ncbi:hypothetical protein ACQPZX_09085 [Actinoplanes sp. CA-142083]|uniref:hypothetical protein n=1 Tax=Actinoplanes sp. CA-142083 TaxID=3239903 RepID=UPI003D904574
MSVTLSLIKGIIDKWRNGQAISKYEVQALRAQAETTLSLVRIDALGEVVNRCLRKVAEAGRTVQESPYLRMDDPAVIKLLETLSSRLDQEVERWSSAVNR